MKQLTYTDIASESSRSEYRRFLEEKSRQELIRLLMMQKDEKIPLSIFENDLGPLEALVKYLKENKHFTLKKISIELNRSSKTIWTTYDAVKDKHLSLKDSQYLIPLSIFTKKELSRLSILESLVQYLKISHSLSYHEIALLLKRDDRTIWTVYDRATKKLKNKK